LGFVCLFVLIWVNSTLLRIIGKVSFSLVSISNTFIFLVTDINPLVCRLQVKEKPHAKEDLAALDGPSTGLKLLAF
jgi:hypothetical protein